MIFSYISSNLFLTLLLYSITTTYFLFLFFRDDSDRDPTVTFTQKDLDDAVRNQEKAFAALKKGGTSTTSATGTKKSRRLTSAEVEYLDNAPESELT